MPYIPSIFTQPTQGWDQFCSGHNCLKRPLFTRNGFQYCQGCLPDDEPLPAPKIIQSLMLADDLFPSLLSGRKLCTIRTGKREIELGPLVFKSVSGKLAPVEVTVDRISYTRAELIAQREAIMDGARNPEELREAMKRFYPDMTDETIVTVVEFSGAEMTKEKWYESFYSYLHNNIKARLSCKEGAGKHMAETLSMLYPDDPEHAARSFEEYCNEGIF